MKNIIPSKINVNGNLCIIISVPFNVELKSNLTLYKDKLGNPYYEEDYEYSVDDIIDKLPQVKNDLTKFKEKGYTNRRNFDHLKIELLEFFSILYM